MVVSEVSKVDFLLKKNGCLMVEYRDPISEWLPLYKMQAILKAEGFLHALKNGLIPKDGETCFLIHIMKSPPNELVDFLRKHHFGVHDNADNNSVKTIVSEKYLPIATASLSMSNQELTTLAEKCSLLFVTLMKKSNLTFDFSLQSLVLLDELIKSQKEHLQNDLTGRDTVALAGLYLGETIRRQLKKEKIDSNWVLLPGMGEFPVILEFSDAKVNPLGKVNKLSKGISGEETEFFAKVVLKQARKEF